jgi:hypothetical protein
MRRILILLLLLPTVGLAGTATWTLPTSYTDNSAIDPADVATLVTDLYMGPTATGPWTYIHTSAPGATSASFTTIRNRWYTGQVYWADNTANRSDYASPYHFLRGKPKPHSNFQGTP